MSANGCVSVFGCMVVCQCLRAWLCVGVCVHGFLSVFGVSKDNEAEAGRNCQLLLFFLSFRG